MATDIIVNVTQAVLDYLEEHGRLKEFSDSEVERVADKLASRADEFLRARIEDVYTKCEGCPQSIPCNLCDRIRG
jgi:hypothetical protein